MHNAGPSTATNVQVTDTFPNQLVLTGNNRPSWTCAPVADCGVLTGIQRGNISGLVTVPANADVTFAITATAGQVAGQFNNSATVTPAAAVINDGTGPFSASASVTIRGSGRLQITKAPARTAPSGGARR